MTLYYESKKIICLNRYAIYADGFNEKEYIRNQNILSDLEVVAISTSSDSPTEMKYDGILYIRYTNAGDTPGEYYLNGVKVIMFEGSYSYAMSGVTLVVSKGDTVYCTLRNATPLCNARFYKLRDYCN